MITQELRDAYPNISKTERERLTHDEFNKLSIKFYEDSIRNHKNALGDIFKNKDVDYPEWYKDLLRDLKTSHEKTLKEIVFGHGYLKDGLNPPFCYPKSEHNPYGFIKSMKCNECSCKVNLKS